MCRPKLSSVKALFLCKDTCQRPKKTQVKSLNKWMVQSQHVCSIWTRLATYLLASVPSILTYVDQLSWPCLPCLHGIVTQRDTSFFGLLHTLKLRLTPHGLGWLRGHSHHGRKMKKCLMISCALGAFKYFYVTIVVFLYNHVDFPYALSSFCSSTLGDRISDRWTS